jgi:hypothetical protein
LISLRFFFISDLLLDVLLAALDITNDAPRHHHENDTIRARSASSSPLMSPITHRNSETNVKPTNLYVSNWTDDEKCRRRKDRMKFYDTQLAER